jgi:ribonuclease BN (tRNA processing enzyme)
MKVQVLGAYGGELGPFRSTAFLLRDRVLLDAGGASGTLDLDAVRRVEAIVLTHAHLDHIASIPFLLDVRIGSPTLEVYAIGHTIEVLKAHLFNDRVWPDFTRIPDARNPLLRYHEIEAGRDFKVGDLRFRAAAVDHSIPTVGYFVFDGRSTVLFSADTGPTDRIWRTLSETRDVRAVFLEVSFPARLEGIARQSKHLSTSMVPGEVRKMPAGTPVLLNHLKPAFLDELHRELAPVLREHPNIRLAEQGRTYEF